MKSKAALFLEEAAKDYDAKDYMPKAMQWWSKLAPEQQKKWLAKLAKSSPDKVAQVYQDLYGAVPSSVAHEDMSKMKKVLAAAVLAAFMTAGAAGAAHAIDYKVVGQDSKGNPIYAVAGSGGSQQGSSHTGSSAGSGNNDKTGDSLSKAATVFNVGAAAVGQFGNSRSQQRAYQTSNNVQFIANALKALAGK